MTGDYDLFSLCSFHFAIYGPFTEIAVGNVAFCILSSRRRASPSKSTFLKALNAPPTHSDGLGGCYAYFANGVLKFGRSNQPPPRKFQNTHTTDVTQLPGLGSGSVCCPGHTTNLFIDFAQTFFFDPPGASAFIHYTDLYVFNLAQVSPGHSSEIFFIFICAQVLGQWATRALTASCIELHVKYKKYRQVQHRYRQVQRKYRQVQTYHFAKWYLKGDPRYRRYRQYSRYNMVNAILRGDRGIAIHDLFSIHGEDASSSVKAKTLSIFALSLYLRVIYARVGLPQYLNATQLSWDVYLNLCPYYDHWLVQDTPVGLQILIESVVLAQLSGNVSEVENLNRELHTHNFIFQEISSNVWRGQHIVEVRVKLGLEFFLGEMRWGCVDTNDLDDVLSCRGSHGMGSEVWSRADGRDEVSRKPLSHTHKKAPWAWYQNIEASHEE
ncbi:hypothetical protein K438DRAFT_1764979 [Mycena galopus ATCC 62051]|nr:hypothetical protein K438DRAFT_1764979 [Mycena galopus ATCC 62051]